MDKVLGPKGITAQVLGTSDSENGSVRRKTKKIPDGLEFVHFKALVSKSGNGPWDMSEYREKRYVCHFKRL